MIPHSETKENVLKFLGTDPASGLTADEAKKRLSEYGENRLAEKKKKSLIARFFGQFADAMILILLAAAGISFVLACMSGEASEFFEPCLILFIVVVNAIIGTAQENRAEHALEALQSLSAPHARVIRGGREIRIDASELVPGDIIRLEAGDFVPADSRIIESFSLKSEESALTGESVPSEKNAVDAVDASAPLGDRTNMLFSGCSVSYGTATAVVCSTGMNTEMGKIANLLESSEEVQTPLQRKLASLGKYLGIAALGACAVIFVVGILNRIPVMEMFMTAVSLAVSRTLGTGTAAFSLGTVIL